MKRIKKIDEVISITLLFLLMFIGFLQVLFRFVLNLPLDWTEESSRYILIILVYLSAVVTVREEKMLRVEIIDLFVKGKAKLMLGTVIQLLSGLFVFYIAYQTTFQVKNAVRVNQLSPAMAIPMATLYIVEGILFFLMGIMFMIVFIKNLKTVVAPQKERN